MKKRYTLQNKMLFINLGISIIPMMVLCLITLMAFELKYTSIVNTSLNSASEHFIDLVESYADDCATLEHSVFNNPDIMTVYSAPGDTRDYIKRYITVNNYFDRMVESHEEIDGILIFCESTQREYSSSGHFNRSLINRAASQHPSSRPIFLYDSTESDGLYCVYDIYSILDDSYGEYIGKGVLKINRTTMARKIGLVRNSENIQSMIFDENHSVVFATDNDTAKGLAENLDKLSNDRKNEFLKINGRKYYVKVSKPDILGWNTAVMLPSYGITPGVNSFSLIFLVLCGIITLAAVILTYVFSKIYTRPIGSLIKSFEDLSNGNFKSYIEVPEGTELAEVCTSFNLMVDNVHELIRRMLSTQEKLYLIEVQKKETDFLSLKSQINSHFLYNTLNCIRGMAMKSEIDNMSRIMDNLIGFLRYSLSGNNDVTVSDEVESLKKYLNIHTARTKGRIHFRLEIQDNAGKCRIMKLLLQPFVENAVIHGLQNSGSRGIIGIKAFCINDRLIIKILDNGVGISKEMAERIENKEISYPSDHLGIANTKCRLNSFYNGDYTIKVKGFKNRGTVITIDVPVPE